MYLTGGRPTKASIKAIIVWLRFVNELHNKMGKPGVVKYTKACSIMLQQSLGGYVIPDIGELGIRVRRTNSGLPKVIPSIYRKAIRNGDPYVIRLWTTLFSIYRNIDYKGVISFKTITDPYSGTVDPLTFESYIDPFLKWFIRVPKVLLPGNPFQILTSSPSVRGKTEYSTSLLSLMRGIYTYSEPWNRELALSIKFMNKFTKSYAILNFFNILIAFCKTYSHDFTGTRNIAMMLRNTIQFGPDNYLKTPYLGSLEIKPEPAGKMRVFAMVDAFTQWSLNPLHKFLFRVFSKWPMDGTTDQLGPLKRVPFGEHIYIASLDLSSATDRLPVSLQSAILSKLFGKDFALHWENLMVGRDFDISKHWSGLEKDQNGVYHTKNPHLRSFYLSKEKRSAIRYAVGQPMGALSSWAMMALTHHLVVFIAAKRSGLSHFTDYALLGDDIVIWNKPVSHAYQIVMNQLGVKLGISKSLVSESGLALEFAKKTLYLGKDLSPFPLKESQAAHSNLSTFVEIQRKYGISDLNIIRFAGYGYRVTPNKSVISMKILRLAKLIPKTGNDFLKLFKLTFLWNEPKFRDEISLLADSIVFLLRDINTEYKSTVSQLDNIRHFMLRLEADIAIPLDNQFASEKANVIYHLIAQPAFIAIERLEEYKQRLKFHARLIQTSGVYYNISCGNHLIAPYMMPISAIEETYIVNSANLLVESIEYRSTISLEDIMTPSRTIPTPFTGFTGKESKRTIRNWNHWFRRLIKTTAMAM